MADPNPFTLRRDSSADQIPTAGVQDGIDAVDIIAFGSRSLTETLNTDSSGFVTLTYPPLDVSHDWVVDGTVGRERKIDGADIQAQTAGGATLYVGNANAATRRVPLFTDGARTVAAASLAGVQVTYRTPVPLTLDASGNLVTVSGGGTGTVADVSDRAARQLGQVTLVPGASLPTDVLDRAARLLGVVQGGIADTVSAANYVVSPGAAQTIAQTAALPAGVYSVEVNAYVNGSGGLNSDVPNMGLYHGSTLVGPIFAPMFSTAAPVARSRFPRVTVGASERLLVAAFGGNGGSVGYFAGITATRTA